MPIVIVLSLRYSAQKREKPLLWGEKDVCGSLGRGVFDTYDLELLIYLELFEFAGFRTCYVRSGLERTRSGDEVYSFWRIFHFTKSAWPKVLVFTEHLANFRVIFILNAEFDVVCIDCLVGFVDCRFPNIGPMIVDNMNVSNSFVSLALKDLCFQDTEDFTVGGRAFHEGDSIFCCFIKILTFR